MPWLFSKPTDTKVNPTDNKAKPTVNGHRTLNGGTSKASPTDNTAQPTVSKANVHRTLNGGTGGEGGEARNGGPGGLGRASRLTQENMEYYTVTNGGTGGKGGRGQDNGGAGGTGDAPEFSNRLVQGKPRDPSLKVEELAVSSALHALLEKSGYTTVGGLFAATDTDLREDGFRTGHINELKHALGELAT
ncbi:hypothetical protein C8R45DRAFT_1212461 [Mycena sanguinolenta]|nr:hypothetical protein C8R45DRAFT_1212461 [Mycena sanguinolenta]